MSEVGAMCATMMSGNLWSLVMSLIFLLLSCFLSSSKPS